MEEFKKWYKENLDNLLNKKKEEDSNRYYYLLIIITLAIITVGGYHLWDYLPGLPGIPDWIKNIGIPDWIKNIGIIETVKNIIGIPKFIKNIGIPDFIKNKFNKKDEANEFNKELEGLNNAVDKFKTTFNESDLNDPKVKGLYKHLVDKLQSLRNKQPEEFKY